VGRVGCGGVLRLLEGRVKRLCQIIRLGNVIFCS
jgi:hypothetical protein